MAAYNTAEIAEILTSAGIECREWHAESGKIAARVYLTQQAVEAFGHSGSQWRAAERRGGIYIELVGDEALVQGCQWAPEAKIEARLIEVLTTAGVAAR